MQTVGILNGENINYDRHFSDLVRGIASQGVVQGFTIVSGILQPGVACVDCTRSNGEKIRVVFETDEHFDLSSLADKTKVFIQIHQANIDDGSLNNEDGTGIGEIVFDINMPSINTLLLAEMVGTTPIEVKNKVTIKDEALEDSGVISGINTEITNIETTISGGIPTQYLSESHIVGEKIVPGTNVGFLQKIANTDENLTEPVNISDVAANTKLEGYFFFKKPENWDGTFSGQLMLDEVGDSTQNLVVELLKVNHDPSTLDPIVTDNLVDPNATATIAHSAISSDKARCTFTMMGLSPNCMADGEHIGIRVYMPVLNSSNYYRWYADATQYSNGLGSSVYNGSSWTNSTNMMGIRSDYLAQGVLCRATTTKVGNKIKIGPKLYYPNYLENTMQVAKKEFVTFGMIKQDFKGYFGFLGDTIVDIKGTTGRDFLLGYKNFFGDDSGSMFKASDTERFADNNQVRTNESNYVTLKSYTSQVEGTIRVVYNLQGSASTVYARLLINGNFVPNSEISTVSNVVTKTIDVDVSKEYFLELQLKGNNSANYNLRVLYEGLYFFGTFKKRLVGLDILS